MLWNAARGGLPVNSLGRFPWLCPRGSASLTISGITGMWDFIGSKRPLTPSPLPLFPLPGEREEGSRGERERQLRPLAFHGKIMG